MMKKMFKALLATGLAVSLLGACGNAKKQDEQKESKQVETSANAEKKTDGEKTLMDAPFRDGGYSGQRDVEEGFGSL